MSSSTMIAQYSSESSATLGPAAKSRRRSSSSLTPDLVQKVSGWLDTQPSVSPFHPIATKRRDENDGSSGSSSSSRKKTVHWTLDVVDNEKKPRRTVTSTRTSGNLSSSRSRVYKSVPLVPEPPRSLAPPPTPRFHRLPTPELSEAGCGNFCDCGKDGIVDKMSAQLAAAQYHMVAANQKSRNR